MPRVSPGRIHPVFVVETGPPGLPHDNPENSKRAFWRALALQTPPKFHEKTPRETKSVISGGRREKSAKFWAPTLLDPHPSGTPTIWPSTFIGFAHPLPLRVSLLLLLLLLLGRRPLKNPPLPAFDFPKCPKTIFTTDELPIDLAKS